MNSIRGYNFTLSASADTACTGECRCWDAD
jgi:hypothetical protein